MHRDARRARRKVNLLVGDQLLGGSIDAQLPDFSVIGTMSVPSLQEIDRLVASLRRAPPCEAWPFRRYRDRPRQSRFPIRAIRVTRERCETVSTLRDSSLSCFPS